MPKLFPLQKAYFRSKRKTNFAEKRPNLDNAKPDLFSDDSEIITSTNEIQSTPKFFHFNLKQSYIDRICTIALQLANYSLHNFSREGEDVGCSLLYLLGLRGLSLGEKAVKKFKENDPTLLLEFIDDVQHTFDRLSSKEEREKFSKLLAIFVKQPNRYNPEKATFMNVMNQQSYTAKRTHFNFDMVRTPEKVMRQDITRLHLQQRDKALSHITYHLFHIRQLLKLLENEFPTPRATSSMALD